MSHEHILIITNKVDAHADIVIDELHARNAKFTRLNTEDFPRCVQLSYESENDDLVVRCLDSGNVVSAEAIKSVWYRRPDPVVIDVSITDEAFRKLARQECTAAMEGLHQLLNEAFWINHPLALRKARPKIFQLSLARRLGFSVPKTIVTNDPDKAAEFVKRCPGDVVTKTLNQPSVDRDEDRFFTIFTHVLSSSDKKTLEAVRYAPTLFQEYIPKKVEIRVTIFGRAIFSAEIHSQQNALTRHDYRHIGVEIDYLPHKLPEKIEDLCLQLVSELGLVFGAIDLILTPNGEYVFLELNSNGQWYWIEQLTELPMRTALVDLLMKGKV